MALPTIILLNIIGGVCLLLWGLKGVKEGMNRAFGPQLQDIIVKCTSNRFKAALAGLGVTTLLQSSTATALIAATFCGQGLMTVSAGLAVILGADVGTTLVAQVLTYDLSWLAPLLMIIGYFMYSFYEKAHKLRHVGKLLFSLGMMMLALSFIKQSAGPMADSEVLPVILGALEKDLVMAFTLSALLAWLAHSTLATILLMATLVTGGILPLDLAIFMVLGVNVGGVFAQIAATWKHSREAARIPLGNLFMRVGGVIIFLPLLGYAKEWLALIDDDPVRLMVNFHTLFNVVVAVIFLPFVGQVGKVCEKVLADTPKAPSEATSNYLDEKQLQEPKMALAGANRETLRLADLVQGMLEDTIRALKHNDEALVREVKKRDDIVDSVFKQLKLYMSKITQESLDKDVSNQYMQVWSFATNLENVGDIIDKSLMEMTLKKIKDRSNFSADGWEDIQKTHNFVVETLRLAQTVFISQDVKLARQLIEGKDSMRKAEVKATDAHMERIRGGVPETIATSSLHLDIIRDYRRINSYIATVAYPILEESGQLRSSRLKQSKK